MTTLHFPYVLNKAGNARPLPRTFFENMIEQIDLICRKQRLMISD